MLACRTGLSIVVLITLGLCPGSNDAVLSGRSRSGRTSFEAKLQDITGLFSGARFTIDGSSIEFTTEEDGDSISTVDNAEKGDFRIFVRQRDGQRDGGRFRGYRYFELRSIPSSFEVVEKAPGKAVYQFQAFVIGTDPRPELEGDSPRIKLNCRLEYEI